MSLTFGFFPEFKGDDTLLIWGSHGFEKLRDLFETVANQSMKSVDFDDTAYLTRAGSCSVSISCTKMDHGKFNIATDGSQTVITCYLNLEGVMHLA
jgi:hypothetical protein